MQNEPTGILDESLFCYLLTLERKRSDRSGRKFLLAAITACSPEPKRQRKNREILHQIIMAVRGDLRETDVIGWYQSNAILGIIFTEIDYKKNDFSKEKLRLAQSLQKYLTADQINGIKVSVYEYPPNDMDELEPSIHVFYPGAKKKSLSQRIKSLIDIVTSGVLIVFLSPLFLLIALGVKITSTGPVLYKQVRVGRFGKKFVFLKFRSMYKNSDSTTHFFEKVSDTYA